MHLRQTAVQLPRHARGRRAVALSIAVAAVVSTACSSGSSGKDSKLGLIKSGTITAATQSDQYPFAFVGTDGKLQGFSIDLVNEIAKRLKVSVTYKTLSLDPLLSGIEADQYDTAAVGLSEKPDRMAKMGFTEPFYYGYFGIIVKKDSDIEGATSLAGKTVAVVTGSAQIDYAQQHYPSAKLKEFPSQPAALAALLGGQADAFFLGGPDTIRYLKQNPSLRLAADIQTGTANAFPTPKGDTKLLKAMNTQLNAIFADGTYAKLYQKWFTEPIPSQLLAAHPELKTS
jgi:polar amino acid transport system substrate-binding protein